MLKNRGVAGLVLRVVLGFGRGVDDPMNRSQKHDETPLLPITFRAAEELGAFELAHLWADSVAWSLNDRTQYDELAELAIIRARQVANKPAITTEEYDAVELRFAAWGVKL